MKIIEQNFIDLSLIPQMAKFVNNDWIGKAIPEGLDITINLACHFDINGKKITGFMDVDDEGDVLRISLEGGIVKLPFLVFDYYSTNPEIINYGRIMYCINNDFTQMEGRVVGYSGERDFFVSARHELAIKQ